MSRLIETIKLEDGNFRNVPYHQARMNIALSDLFGVNDKKWELEDMLRRAGYPEKGLHKCRILYDDETFIIGFEPYQMRKVRHLKAVNEDTISYAYKFEDRADLNRIFDLRQECDDVLIIKQGRVTDCSFANIAFKKGSVWFTPDKPLLKGTMRQKLLDENKIRTTEILERDIRSYETFRLINAMLEFQSPEIEVSRIVF